MLDIDVQGAEQVNTKKEQLPAKFVFFRPPSMEELEKRLRGRATDSEESIKKRLGNAAGEIEKAEALGIFHFITNADLESCYASFSAHVLDDLSSALENVKLGADSV